MGETVTFTARYVRHIDLGTGATHDSCWGECDEALVRRLRAAVKKSLGTVVPMPIDTHGEGFAIMAMSGRDRALVVSVWGPLVGSPIAARPPVAEIVVAPSSLAGAMIWREWMPKDGTAGDKPHPAPWSARKAHCQGIGWITDFERCLAWAWIDR